MPIYRRRYPRPDATQDGATARGSLQALIPWMAGIHAAELTFSTRKRPPRFPGLKTEFQQAPAIFREVTLDLQKWVAGMDARQFRTLKRKPRFPGLKTEFQQGPYIFREASLDLAKWWPAVDGATRTFQTRRRRPRKQPYTTFWPFQYMPGTAFLVAATARMAERTPNRRGEYRHYQTVFDDGWIFTQVPPPFNPALVAGMYGFADRTRPRAGEYRPYQTVFDDGWLFPAIPVPPAAGEQRMWRRSLGTWHRSSS